VEACTQFGVRAIRHHVTVTSLPPACRGLTRAQIDVAVGTALHSAAIGARGKAAQRERVAKASHFLERLVTTVPAQRSQPRVSAPPARGGSRTVLGLIAASTWLITVGLGLRMMARWMAPGRVRMMARWVAHRRLRRTAGQRRRSPVLNFAHFGLATTGLLAWAVYVGTGVTGLAWAACALLPLVAGLGMALVFSSVPQTRLRRRQLARPGTVHGVARARLSWP
jgi:hypothetical protein